MFGCNKASHLSFMVSIITLWSGFFVCALHGDAEPHMSFMTVNFCPRGALGYEVIHQQ